MIAVVFIAVAAGAIIVMTRMTGVTAPDDSSVSSGGGSIDISIPAGPSIPSVEVPSVEVPDAPSVPAIPAPPGVSDAEANVIVGTPGQTVTVSGIDENKTVTCNDAAVTISGIRNTVTITGHCVDVLVSGIENDIKVDAADSISTSGFRNDIKVDAADSISADPVSTTRSPTSSGEPQIDANGSNSVQQG